MIDASTPTSTRPAGMNPGHKISIMAENSGYSVTRLLIIGLVFHLVFIGSVFDCYFVSPVVKGMQSFKLPSAESKRLVLIIGLRY
jgi:hypothetical protein